jgi:hypothetical protein
MEIIVFILGLVRNTKVNAITHPVDSTRDYRIQIIGYVFFTVNRPRVWPLSVYYIISNAGYSETSNARQWPLVSKSLTI